MSRIRSMFSTALGAVLAVGAMGVSHADAVTPTTVPTVVQTSAAKGDITPPQPTKRDKAYKPTTKERTASKALPSEFRTFACPCYNWTGARQTLTGAGTATSFAANLHVENTYLNTGAGVNTYHTLAQLHVKSAGDEAVEFGWMRDTTGTMADSQPRLFAGIRKNGVWQGYGTGFVDYAPNVTYTYGSVVPTGTPKRFQIASTGTAWWLAYDGAWIGYFLNSSFSPDTFTNFNLMQGFYEVADRGVQSCADMGNGIDGGSGTAARVGSASVTGTVPAEATNITAFDEPTGSLGYSVLQVTADTVRAGGPGANAALTGVGSTGSC